MYFKMNQFTLVRFEDPSNIKFAYKNTVDKEVKQF